MAKSETSVTMVRPSPKVCEIMPVGREAASRCACWSWS